VKRWTSSSSAAQVETLLAPVLKGHAIESVVRLGEGCDHLAFEVNGELIARLRKDVDEHTAGGIAREVQLLEILSRVSPIPVPEVAGTNGEAGLIVVRRLPGTSLFERPAVDPMALVDQLAQFLAAIHGLPTVNVLHLVDTDDYPLEAHLADAAALMSQVAGHLPQDSRRAVEAFLAAPPPRAPETRAFCHNDLGAEHLLASPDRTFVTGVIDWSDAAIADPAKDLGLLFRDLGRSATIAIATQLESAVSEGILERAAFHARCGLIEDLAYGLQTTKHLYVERALANLRHTFDGDC
jgi:aminoglycoside phosphotransferase (APT) family kinase protein